MARYTGPVCKRCRREGVRLFLKGNRCRLAKCGLVKREFPPGEHRWSRRKASDYALHLRDKQKVARWYGLMDLQLQRYLNKAERMKGNSGENLMTLLELRLDNVLYRSGVALSRRQARQLIGHGHVRVNGRRVNRPGYSVAPGQTISFDATRKKSAELAKGSLAEARGVDVPGWIRVDPDGPVVAVQALPTREEVSCPQSKEDRPAPFNEQHVVEYYSR